MATYHLVDHLHEFLFGPGHTLGAAFDADDVAIVSVGWHTNGHAGLVLDSRHCW